jgi:hypothetical protein
MKANYHTPDFSRQSFARTNRQTIAQRVAILRRLAPGLDSVAEVCCGDCTRQKQIYTGELGVSQFRGLDLEAAIVAENHAKGVDCYQGDALSMDALRRFAQDAAVFFGPPLSEACDGHRGLNFDEVQPAYRDFARLFLGELRYDGLLVCICPKTTDMGNITRLYRDIRSHNPDVNLRLIHHSYTTLTGNDEVTELRLKYVELWFSSQHEDRWEVLESRGFPESCEGGGVVYHGVGEVFG